MAVLLDEVARQIGGVPVIQTSGIRTASDAAGGIGRVQEKGGGQDERSPKDAGRPGGSNLQEARRWIAREYCFSFWVLAVGTNAVPVVALSRSGGVLSSTPPPLRCAASVKEEGGKGRDTVAGPDGEGLQL